MPSCSRAMRFPPGTRQPVGKIHSMKRCRLLLSTDVYNTLLNELLDGTLQPGVFLNRRQVAEQIGVSVAPVLQAMIQLENEGFLRTIPRKGTIVRTLTKEEIKGNLILKEAIECAAAERCSGETVLEHYDELKKMAWRLDYEFPDRNTIEAWKLDLELHKKLVSLAGYDVLTAEFVRIAVPNLFYHVNRGPNYGDHSKRSHMVLLEAMTSTDRSVAINELKLHLWSGKTI